MPSSTITLGQPEPTTYLYGINTPEGTIYVRVGSVNVIDGTLFLYNSKNGIVFGFAPGHWHSFFHSNSDGKAASLVERIKEVSP